MIERKKKIVVIGGGNGSAIALVALKQNADLFDISAVISMSDSTGSSGRLRKEHNFLPPGDIMRAVLAMSQFEYPLLKKIFYKNRISNLGNLDGHNLGNLFVYLASKYNGGDIMSGVRALEQVIAAVGHTYPVTLTQTDLVAELSNGDIVRTEGEIDTPKYDRSLRLKKMWLEPHASANPEAIKIIEDSDYIVLSPGSLYTSVIAAFLPNGVSDAIKKSKAKIIFVAGNAYRLDGETGPGNLSGIIHDLEMYLPRKVDTTIYCNHKQNKEESEFYAGRMWGLFKIDLENLAGCDVRGYDFERKGGGLCSEKLGGIFKDVIT